MTQSRRPAHSGPEQSQGCLVIVAATIVAEFAGVDDLEIVVERTVLVKREFRECTELVKRNDLGDLGVPISDVARWRGPTLLSQIQVLRAVTISLSGSGDLTKLTGLWQVFRRNGLPTSSFKNTDHIGPAN